MKSRIYFYSIFMIVSAMLISFYILQDISDIYIQGSCFLIILGIIYKGLQYSKIQQYSSWSMFYIGMTFCICLFPIVALDSKEYDELENRKLATKPNLWKEQAINFNFGDDVEAWIKDHFYKRRFVIDSYQNISQFFGLYKTNRILGNNDVLSGKEQWLFYRRHNSIGNFQNSVLFSDKELHNIYKAIQERKSSFKEDGIAFYIFIAPDKNRIYGEYYPDSIHKVREKGRVEELEAFLVSQGEQNFIYPYKALLEEKNKGLLYWKTDTHWNDEGGFIGYKELINRIKQHFPNISIVQEGELNKEKIKEQGGDLLQLLAGNQSKRIIEELYSDIYHTRLTLKKGYSFKYLKNEDNNSSGGGVKTISSKRYKVLVFRDSFTSSMIPFISESFGEVEYIWNHNINKFSSYIREQKPNIIILEIVERSVDKLLSVLEVRKES